MSKVRVCITIDQGILKVLQARKDREGKPISEQIEDAVRDQFYVSQVHDELIKAGRVMQGVKDELARLNDELARLNDELQILRERQDRLEEWVRVVAFWSAVISEMTKSKLVSLKALTEEEHERWKKIWNTIHERADLRIEQLTGERVWKQKFNPEVKPSG